jgi:GGDEF domain-containing protein
LVFCDITEKLTKKKRNEYLGFHDELTGLGNRRYLEAK